jgi:cleavage and polyadenylation specificity factor subunit 3
VRLLGRLADKPPVPGAVLRGVLVRSGGAASGSLLHPDDLPRHTKLLKGRVTQRQALAVDVPFSRLRLALEARTGGKGRRRVSTCAEPSSRRGTWGLSGGPSGGCAAGRGGRS